MSDSTAWPMIAQSGTVERFYTTSTVLTIYLDHPVCVSFSRDDVTVHDPATAICGIGRTLQDATADYLLARAEFKEVSS